MENKNYCYAKAWLGSNYSKINNVNCYLSLSLSLSQNVKFAEKIICTNELNKKDNISNTCYLTLMTRVDRC